jgi:hypothetical protein
MSHMLAPRARAVPPSVVGAGVAAATAVALAVLAAVAGWQGSDWPAHVFRVELVERDGMEVWNNYWYGGHHTLGYGVLFPVLGALVGMWTVAVASAAASAVLVDALVRGTLGRTCWPATLWFAAGTLTNVAIGRLPFALGLTVGLGALLALQRNRIVLAGALTLATAAASPVVSAFLAVVYAGWFLVGDRKAREQAVALAVLALGPVLVIAALYPQGGVFPFRVEALLATLAMCVLVWALVPGRHRLVRATVGVYAAASVVAFAVPTPLGANLTRLGMYATGPVLLALAPRTWWRAGALVASAWWLWSPAVDAITRAPRDPTTQEAFYRPLLTYLDSVEDDVARVEVVPTARHWEAAHVAPRVPLARGWERQLDTRFNTIFYDGDGPTPTEYLVWLLDTGVEYVALPDARLDPSGRNEAALLESGLPYLEEVWSGDDWRVWSVVGATGMVDGPAQLVELTADRLVLDVQGAGDVVVRVRSSAFWASQPRVCIEPTDDGWIVLRDLWPGRIEVYLDEAVVVELDDPCEPP